MLKACLSRDVKCTETVHCSVTDGPGTAGYLR